MSSAAKTSLYLCLLVLAVVSVYHPALDNRLTNWDDNVYITDNALVRDLSLTGLGNIWKAGSVGGNYHPLTMTLVALEYRLFGASPAPYHAASLALHLLNTLLAFWLVSLLFRQKEIALVAALLFGVHPLHVESVAWAAEQKDLLYGLFYLAGLISYVQYLDKGRPLRRYVLTLLLFVCSLLSKSMAVMFPVHLLLLDHWRGRKLDLRSILVEKLPFWALSLSFGIMAIFSQRAGGALSRHQGLLKNILVACHGLLFYPAKLLAPFGLSAVYPYPAHYRGFYPWQYLAAPAAVLLLSWLVYRNRKRWPAVFLASAFYAISVLPVLQLFPAGGAVAADRYVYIASLGFFALAGYGMNKLWTRAPAMRYIRQAITVALILIACFYGSLARRRIQAWHDSFSLWNDVIRKYPETALAYNKRGGAWRDLGYYNEAEKDFGKAIMLDPLYENAYGNRGELRIITHRLDQAMEDYQRVISLDSLSSRGFNNRGYIFLNRGQYREALDDFNRAVALEPEYADAIYNRSYVYHALGKEDSMLADLNRVLNLDAGYRLAYSDRGLYYLSISDTKNALGDFNRSLGLKQDDPEIRFHLAKCYYAMDDVKNARQNAEIAEALGYTIPPQFRRQLGLTSH